MLKWCWPSRKIRENSEKFGKIHGKFGKFMENFNSTSLVPQDDSISIPERVVNAW